MLRLWSFPRRHTRRRPHSINHRSCMLLSSWSIWIIWTSFISLLLNFREFRGNGNTTRRLFLRHVLFSLYWTWDMTIAWYPSRYQPDEHVKHIDVSSSYHFWLTTFIHYDPFIHDASQLRHNNLRHFFRPIIEQEIYFMRFFFFSWNRFPALKCCSCKVFCRKRRIVHI